MGAVEAARILMTEFPIHIFVSVSSALFFYMCFKLFLRVTDVHEHDRVSAANTAASLIHATITGIWSSISIVGIMSTGNFMGTSIGSELLMAFMIGFFAFDIAVLYANSREMKLSYAFILHHICAMATYGGCVWCRMGVNYCIISVSSEVSNVFLHARKLMHYEGVSRTNIFYLVNSLLGVFTSFTSRILSFMTINYRLTFVEPYIPGYMGEIVAFGNIVVFGFTVAIFNALLKDFRPKVDRAKNGSASMISSKDN